MKPTIPVTFTRNNVLEIAPADAEIIDVDGEKYLSIKIKIDDELEAKLLGRKEIVSVVVSPAISVVSAEVLLLHKKIILLKGHLRELRVAVDQIMYGIADGAYTFIHIKDVATFHLSKNLGETELFLASALFFRANKTLLVNKLFVKPNASITSDKQCMLDDLEFIIGRTKRAEYRDWYYN